MSSILQIHLARKGDKFYNQGRKLAENVYREIWGTENLLDGNDYGVIVSQNYKVLGNINIQFRRSRNLLRSEVFFGEKHWQGYSEAQPSQIAEPSTLVLAQEAPKQLRRPTMMTLILGIYLICHAENINFVATIQHDYLIRILSKSFRLPFFRNEYVKYINGKVPKDKYWNGGKLPRLYYCLPDSIHTINACASFLKYLPETKIVKSDFPVIKPGSLLERSTFPEHWDKVKNYNFPDLKVRINEIAANIASSLNTTAKIGDAPSDYSIRVGTVKMEEHPGYQSLIDYAESQGFLIIEEDDETYVKYAEIVDRNLNVIDIEKELHLIPYMRFIDLEHEIGHIKQLERFNFKKYTHRYKQGNDGKKKQFEKNAPHVLQPWQNIVTEYHNCLNEFLRLYQHDASSELLFEHSNIDTGGIGYWQRLYKDKIFNKGRSSQKIKWVEEYFPDMGALKTQYERAIEALKLTYPDIHF